MCFSSVLVIISCVGHWIAEHTTVLATVVSALAAVAVVIFTARLSKASNEQGELTRQSIDLARDEFLSSHRPQIRIKHVFLNTKIWDGNAMNVVVHIVNSGSRKAILRSFRFDILLSEDGKLPRQAKNMARNTILLEREKNITPGGNGQVRIPEVPDWCEVLKGFDGGAIKENRKRLYFVGAVVYAGESTDKDTTHEHTTAFCRVLCFNDPNNPRLNGARFVPLKRPDSDYEYED